MIAGPRVVTVYGSLMIGMIIGCGAESDSVTSTSLVGDGNVSSGVEIDSLVLAAMPEGVVTSPTEIMELEGEAKSTVLAGRIDAGDMDPFQPGEIAFMISQLPDEGHGESDPDHADNCPFCKRKLASAPKAIVQFRGADGKVLSGDARQALSLQKGDVVYVAGTAQFNSAVNTVMVDATGLFKKSN
jgi:hypothetical protein